MLIEFWRVLISLLLGLATVVGLGLLLVPQQMLQAFTMFNHWLSPRRLLHPTETPVYIERIVYRHHKLVGVAISLGSAYCLYWLVPLDSDEVVRFLPGVVPTALGATAARFALITLIIGNLMSLAIGIMIYVRPSLLRTLEQGANTWVSTRRALAFLDTPHFGPDRLALRAPRLMGATITILVTLVIFLISKLL